MNVFQLRDRLITDYRNYVESFIKIRDERIKKRVAQVFSERTYWPDPLIQLNPAFAEGDRLDDLVAAGILNPACLQIFRANSVPLRLHRHQSEAVRIAGGGHNYVLTTGTGSGKSLAYIIPIVDHILRQGAGRGIQAIIVYPMNALANSQAKELDKFLSQYQSSSGKPIKVAKYTGEVNEEQRRELKDSPPDILLTNYVMLELMLTRPSDEAVINAAGKMRYLVLDELHTYRGRQGADVALLVRRACNRLAPNRRLQIVGTSATLVGNSDLGVQQREVAAVASQLFGQPVHPEHVIGETLRRTTIQLDDPAELRTNVLDYQPAPDYTSFVSSPLSSWLESKFGIIAAPDGRLIRATPRSIWGPEGAALDLSRATGVPVEECAGVIEQALLDGSRHKISPDARGAAFAFRLHQFISRGDAAYASLEPEADRYITVNNQQYKPGDRNALLYPLAFCRQCGQEFYSVRRNPSEASNTNHQFTAREPGDQSTTSGRPGFLYLNTTNPWPFEWSAICEKLPGDWLDLSKQPPKVLDKRKDAVPHDVYVRPDGQEAADGLRCQFLPSPFLFCPNCRVTYEPRQRSDFAKLATLSSEGRSTATTVLSLSAIRNLRNEADLAPSARKLLSFTDNRQDASLQAGHFNDFIEVGLIRSALYRAAKDTPAGLDHETLTLRVFQALDLAREEYASNPDAFGQARHNADQALRGVLGYRLYRDLKRGWRITAPNLEQCGLLKVQYPYLAEVCATDAQWGKLHPALATASHYTREQVARELLDTLRRDLAIKVEYLDSIHQESIQSQSKQELVQPWAMDEVEGEVHGMEFAAVAYPGSRQSDDRANIYISPYGRFGLYLRNNSTFPNLSLTDKPKREDCATIIADLLHILALGGLLEVVEQRERRRRRGQREVEQPPTEEMRGYQLKASAMRWIAADDGQEEDNTHNQFFRDFYRTVATNLGRLVAHEHTAQVPNALREEREEAFREGRLPVLYCSPTMELGVDIADLNVVNLRNVPPTPANYAQRSGRAGRNGQPALVFSYCATGSSHDQYFFKHQDAMVSGKVKPPRLDLNNEDLVRAHIQAIWLAATGVSLGESLKEVIDLNDPQKLPLRQDQRDLLEDRNAWIEARRRSEQVLATLDLSGAAWYANPQAWLDEVFNNIVDRFDLTANRWRDLYRAASRQRDVQNDVIGDHTRNSTDKLMARGLRAEAEAQLELLTEGVQAAQSDFYSYRYFASEGFLPGYSFPRLPLSAFIPAPRIKQGGKEGTYLSRPRFLAVSEFGPRAVVYHEGSRYVIERVILPISSDTSGQRDLRTSDDYICPACGYFHPGSVGAALCQRCSTPLEDQLTVGTHKPRRVKLKHMFRLQNVATRRRDKISSDEEERMRIGYEIITAFRFSERQGRPDASHAEVQVAGTPLLNLTYGQTATIYRINLGWLRRENKAQLGFVLDVDRGYWAKNSMTEDAEAGASGRRQEIVIPYVEDRRNSLLLEVLPAPEVGERIDWRERRKLVASMMAALKLAIQIEYQLEDNELAAEMLPDAEQPHLILLYEAAEGGAGVLHRLLGEPGAVARVAARALEVCHFDPLTGADQHRAVNAREDCEAACYNCLLNYQNQIHHELLDRFASHNLLLRLTQATTHEQAAATTSAVVASLTDTRSTNALDIDANLAARWLDYVQRHGLRLPDQVQPTLPRCASATPDFAYAKVAIYIDGDEQQANRDLDKLRAYRDQGWSVIRFGSDEESWAAAFGSNQHIFGETHQ